MKQTVDIQDIVRVAHRLEPLGTRYVFTGGAVVGFLLDRPHLAMSRATKDVDVIAEILTRIQYTDLEDRLRRMGFRHDLSEGASKCRWIVDEVKVDVMPAACQIGEFSSRWFDLAVKSAMPIAVMGTQILIVTAPCILATKIEAFNDRGLGDYMASHDIEDILTLVDGREALRDEVDAAPNEVRAFIIDSFGRFLKDARFHDSLPGHLPPDAASQERLPNLLQRLESIARLV